MEILIFKIGTSPKRSDMEVAPRTLPEARYVQQKVSGFTSQFKAMGFYFFYAFSENMSDVGLSSKLC